MNESTKTQTPNPHEQDDFGLYLDFENLWIQNRKQLFPNYDWESDKLNGAMPTPEQRNLMYKHFGMFVHVLEQVIRDGMGKEPRWRHVAAVWEKLERNSEQRKRIENALNGHGYHIHQPKNYPSTLTTEPGGMKEAADRELCFKIIDGIIFRKEAGLSSIVVGTGDYFAARLMGFIREHRDVAITVACFRNSVSKATLEILKTGNEQERILYLDDHPIYQDYMNKARKEIGFEVSPFDLQISMTYTAIFYIFKTKMEYINPAFFHKWIKGWTDHYSAQQVGIEVESDPAVWCDIFCEKGILIMDKPIMTKTKGQKRTVFLVRENEMVANSINDIEQSANSFRERWSVAPAT